MSSLPVEASPVSWAWPYLLNKILLVRLKSSTLQKFSQLNSKIWTSNLECFFSFLYKNLFFFVRLNRFSYIWVLKCKTSACRFLNAGFYCIMNHMHSYVPTYLIKYLDDTYSLYKHGETSSSCECCKLSALILNLSSLSGWAAYLFSEILNCFECLAFPHNVKGFKGTSQNFLQSSAKHMTFFHIFLGVAWWEFDMSKTVELYLKPGVR